MGLLPTKFEGSDNPEQMKHYEHIFFNPDLRLFRLHSSEDLFRQHKQQQLDIISKVPETDQYPSIFGIVYDMSVDVDELRFMLEKRLITKEQLPYGEKVPAYIEGASFKRVRKTVSFTPNEIYRTIYTEQNMRESCEAKRLFLENGAAATVKDFKKRWNTAYGRIYKHKPSRETLGAIVKSSYLWLGPVDNPEQPGKNAAYEP